MQAHGDDHDDDLDSDQGRQPHPDRYRAHGTGAWRCARGRWHCLPSSVLQEGSSGDNGDGQQGRSWHALVKNQARQHV